jgi:iron only hydrogenase large subunit-like protein
MLFMDQAVTDVRQFRSRVLKEVARMTWQHRLENDIDQLPDRIMQEGSVPGKSAADQRNRVEKHIRLAMGLDPNGNGESLKAAAHRALSQTKGEFPVVLPVGHCEECTATPACQATCPTDAITHDAEHRLQIEQTNCNACGMCITACSLANLADKVEFVPLLNILQKHQGPVFAAVAPAFTGQFGPDVTPGKLRSALRSMGFVEMAEVALFADILTIKEAFEFDHLVKGHKDFMITSCCCPVWINLLEKQFPDLLKNISPSVSPMIAAGRVLKTAVPDAKVVFIGPCVAKKAEARHKDLEGAIDFVLTFKELSLIFEALDLDPAKLTDLENPQASWAGRAYARTGGVAASILKTLEKIAPWRSIQLNPVSVDGVPACQQILREAQAGTLTVNFLEGMACKGGCIGGPGVNIDPDIGTRFVHAYCNQAEAPTPLDNEEVLRILHDLKLDDMSHIVGDGDVSRLLRRELTRR